MGMRDESQHRCCIITSLLSRLVQALLSPECRQVIVPPITLCTRPVLFLSSSDRVARGFPCYQLTKQKEFYLIQDSCTQEEICLKNER